MISDNLHSVRARIAAACNTAGRDVNLVTLLAVSKTFGPEAVLEAIAAGQTAFGENYIQEAVQKIQHIRQWEAAHPLRPSQPSQPSEWHCIGPIQSNKTRLVAENFDWVHTLDRLKIAERLSEQRPAHLPPLQVCLQVNIDDGPNKSGVAPQDLAALAAAVAKLPRLCLRGLMAIPEPTPDLVANDLCLLSAYTLFSSMKSEHASVDCFSLGMSADLEPAIQNGSTMVRIGTAIFGNRDKH